MARLDEPYPGGESWRQATGRVARFLSDLPLRWEGRRVLVVGHVATYWGLDCTMNAAELTSLVLGDFHCQEGWEFFFDDSSADHGPRVGD